MSEHTDKYPGMETPETLASLRAKLAAANDNVRRLRTAMQSLIATLPDTRALLIAREDAKAVLTATATDAQREDGKG